MLDLLAMPSSKESLSLLQFSHDAQGQSVAQIYIRNLVSFACISGCLVEGFNFSHGASESWENAEARIQHLVDPFNVLLTRQQSQESDLQTCI